MEYSYWKTAEKAGRAFLKDSAAIVLASAVPALLGYWTPEQIGAVLTVAGVKPLVVLVLIPVIHGALSALQNWSKHRVPAEAKG